MQQQIVDKRGRVLLEYLSGVWAHYVYPDTHTTTRSRKSILEDFQPIFVYGERPWTWTNIDEVWVLAGSFRNPFKGRNELKTDRVRLWLSLDNGCY